MKLQVMVVEDSAEDMVLFKRELPEIFSAAGEEADFHWIADFGEANKLVDDPSRRFDLIVSDTYKGPHANHEAAVLDMVRKYRGGRFCPIIVVSASVQPEGFEEGAFVVWVDKANVSALDEAIRSTLAAGIPQIARSLHDDLDQHAGTYLWEFLDRNWMRLKRDEGIDRDSLIRLIRRRAALQLSEIVYSKEGGRRVEDVSGHEVYMYPPLSDEHYSLGEVIRARGNHNDIRVILTPHCFLTAQPGEARPKAEYVVTVKAVLVRSVVGAKLDTIGKEANPEKRFERIRNLINAPSSSDVGKPAGRYWYLPKFLDVPDLYCDFLQVESLHYPMLEANFEELAVLAPPFAESLQACFGAFHGRVGTPKVTPQSVARGLLS